MAVTRTGHNRHTKVDPGVLKALGEFQRELNKIYGVQAPTLLLYGSYARGDASPESDVDVILLYSRDIQPGKEIHLVREILSTLNLRHQVLISVLPVSIDHFKNNNTAFWHHVRTEVVSIDSD